MGTEADYLIDQRFDREHGEYGDERKAMMKKKKYTNEIDTPKTDEPNGVPRFVSDDCLRIANKQIAILTKAMQEVIDRYPQANPQITVDVIWPLRQALEDADNVKE